MMTKLKDVLQRAGTWPKAAQERLAEFALEMEVGLAGEYRATPEELEAIDEADRSGVASSQEVANAFSALRRA